MNRRNWLQITLASLATSALTRNALASPSVSATRVTVYKSPTCGCCANWVSHMKKNGFDVDAHDVDDGMLEQV